MISKLLILTLFHSLVKGQALPVAPLNTTFNSTFSLSAEQIASASLTPELARSVDLVINFDRSQLANGGPRQDEFYTLPSPIATEPGQVLKVQEVTDPAPFAIAPGSSLSRILYTTETFNGTVVPASAFVLWPFQPRQFKNGSSCSKPQSGPAVLWTHGTSGYFADSAPSSFRSLYYGDVFPNYVAQEGYIVVAPDYAGLGVGQTWNGTAIHHQYFVGAAGAKDSLYAMEAVKKAFPSRLNRFAVAGHSQGGGVAWSVAELLTDKRFQNLAKSHVGTIPFAPVLESLTGPFFSTVSIALHLRDIFPDFKPSDWLTPLGVSRLELLRQIQGSSGVAQQLLLSDPADSLLKPDWYNSSYHARAFEKLVDVGKRHISGPMLVVQGGHDVFVNAITTAKITEDTCQTVDKANIELISMPTFGHTPIIEAARPLWTRWLEDRFDGKEVYGCS